MDKDSCKSWTLHFYRGGLEGLNALRVCDIRYKEMVFPHPERNETLFSIPLLLSVLCQFLGSKLVSKLKKALERLGRPKSDSRTGYSIPKLGIGTDSESDWNRYPRSSIFARFSTKIWARF